MGGVADKRRTRTSLIMVFKWKLGPKKLSKTKEFEWIKYKIAEF